MMVKKSYNHFCFYQRENSLSQMSLCIYNLYLKSRREKHRETPDLKEDNDGADEHADALEQIS